MEVQRMLSELLDSLGFAAMARDVLSETDHKRIAHYARIIVRNAPADKRRSLETGFFRLRIL